jgi:hypothetical protein
MLNSVSEVKKHKKLKISLHQDVTLPIDITLHLLANKKCIS